MSAKLAPRKASVRNDVGLKNAGTLEERIAALEAREQARILGVSKALYLHTTTLMNLVNEIHDTIEKLDTDLVEKGLMSGASSATQDAYSEWLFGDKGEADDSEGAGKDAPVEA